MFVYRSFGASQILYPGFSNKTDCYRSENFYMGFHGREDGTFRRDMILPIALEVLTQPITYVGDSIGIYVN